MGQQEAELRRVRNQLADLQKEQTQLEQRLDAGRQQQNHVEKSVKEAQSEIEKVCDATITNLCRKISQAVNVEKFT